MFRITRTRIIGLAMVGAVALGGAIYATTALAAGGATASAPTAQAVQGATDPQLRTSILDMLKDRMGLTGPDAEQFADQMIDRMQNVNPDFDFQAMVDWCTGSAADGAQGYGMMNGGDWGYGRYGMMGGTPTPNGGSADKGSDALNGPGPQENSSGFTRFTPGSIMGGSAYGNDSANDGEYMMDAASGPNAEPSNQGDQGGNTPSDPGPPDEDSSPAYRGVMGNGMMGDSMMGR